MQNDSFATAVERGGTRGRFRLLRARSYEDAGAAPVESSLGQADAERIARDFVVHQLTDAIKVPSGEELVVRRAFRNLRGGSATKHGGPRPASVARSWTVIFGRRVRGVDIVGAGSQVVVDVANVGVVVRAEYDWPRYEPAAETEVVAPREVILDRVAAVTFPSEARAPRTMSPALATSDAGEPDSLECGYYDPGGRDAPVAVHAGCAYRRVRLDPNAPGQMRAAVSGAVPAAKEVPVEPTWKEAAMLRSTDSRSTDSQSTNSQSTSSQSTSSAAQEENGAMK